MAGNIFLKLNGITGASEVFEGEIELSSFNWGLSNEKNVHSGSTTSTSTAHIYNISCTKPVDSGSPTIMQKCADGEKFDTATLKIAAAGAGSTPQPALQLDMTDVYISSYTTSASGTATDLAETFAIHFAKIKTSYQKYEGGKASGASNAFSWNAQKNVKS